MEIEFVHESEVEPRKLPGRESKVLIGPKTVGCNEISFGITETPPRTAMSPPHKHDKETEVIYVIEGEGEITSGNEVKKIFPGTAMYISPGVEHNIENKSDVIMKLACAFHPAIDLEGIPDK